MTTQNNQTPIPATIITGFLGAGKTTLLKRILTEEHGQKIAVIENEYGQENIDTDILISETNENIIQMSNGCICCTIREDLRGALSQLIAQKRAGKLNFERVVIETTGLADPGPVAQTFFMDDEIAENYLLDAIITLVDAKHANQQLNEHEPAQRQIGFADHILISKTDLINEEELNELKHRLAHMNPRAQQTIVNHGQTPLKNVLDLRGFNLNTKLDIDPDFLPRENKEHHHHEHGEKCGHECNHHHHKHQNHDDKVKSFVFKSKKPFDPAKLEDFLGAIVNVYGPKMLRYKGVLYMKSTPHKVIFQGVHQLMGSDLGPKWKEGEQKESKMVFIGIDLPQDIMTQGLEQSLAK